MSGRGKRYSRSFRDELAARVRYGRMPASLAPTTGLPLRRSGTGSGGGGGRRAARGGYAGLAGPRTTCLTGAAARLRCLASQRSRTEDSAGIRNIRTTVV